jgi:hypothetical protein
MADDPYAIDPSELPEVITAYLKAHTARDVDLAVNAYVPDGTVIDEGTTYRGHDAIRQWLSRSAGEYTYTIEMTGASRINDATFDVQHHLEGNFPGEEADLHFRFTLRDGAIATLIIEE